MFGHSMFRDDPFFRGGAMEEFERMDHMMSSMHQSFGMPSIMGQSNHFNQHRESHNRALSMRPFGRSMLGDMDSMMASMTSGNPAGGQFYSSSKVVSYSSNGSGQPKMYEASSETVQGPGGVRRTKKSERNSETGVDRMAVGHHIHDRGHVVERSRNNRTNEREEKQDYINMDENDRDAFHQEWQQKAHVNRANRAIRSERTPYRQEPRAINSADYHRQNLDRARARRRDDGRHGDFSQDRH